MTKTETLEAKRAQKQKRAKARRKARKMEAAITEVYKPVSEWDEEELSQGRPRAVDGTFRGRPPKWVSRELHEEAVKIFTEQSQAKVRGLVPKALTAIEMILTNTEMDERGRFVVPVSTKAETARWVIEHLVGKPTQRIEADISVKLQAVLAGALVSPDEQGQLMPAIDAESWEDEDEDFDKD